MRATADVVLGADSDRAISLLYIDERVYPLVTVCKMSHTSTVTHAAEPSTGETSALRLRGSFPAINGTRLNETLHESCQWGW